MYRAQVKAVTLPVTQWLEEFCSPGRFAEACKACPDYGRIWSCPPGVPAAREAFAPYERVHIVGVKVIYDEAARAAAVTPERTEELRRAAYGEAKAVLRESLLELEKVLPGSWSVAAGRCELCGRCSRADGEPCRRPERMRLSFSGFGFDLGRVAEELLGMPLLWAAEGLPEYHVAVAALLERGAQPEDGLELEQKYIVADTQPWDQFQDEVMGVLRRMGCTVERQGDVRQRDVYYDTADDALLRGGCSLRMRTAGEAALLTWKGKPAERQGGLFARQEEELPVFDGDLRGERVRTFLRSCLAELPGTGPEMLKRCAEVENHRRLVRVADGGGVYELAFDEVAYTGPAGGHPCRERQMELEHKAGGSEGLARLAAALQSALPGLVCAQGSKYQRARTLLG